jgi:hypothetical protein
MRRQSLSRLFFFERGEARLVGDVQLDLAPQVQHAGDRLGIGQLVEADAGDVQFAGWLHGGGHGRHVVRWPRTGALRVGQAGRDAGARQAGAEGPGRRQAVEWT